MLVQQLGWPSDADLVLASSHQTVRACILRVGMSEPTMMEPQIFGASAPLLPGAVLHEAARLSTADEQRKHLIPYIMFLSLKTVEMMSQKYPRSIYASW